MRRGMLFGLAAVAGSCGSVSQASDLLYQSQSRQVEAAIFYPDGHSSELQLAPDFGPFNAGAAADYNSPQGPGLVNAWQASVLEPHGLEVSGSVLIQNPFFASEVALYSARCIFDVSFLLTQTVPFTFSAEFSGLWDTGGTNVNSGAFLMTFTGPDGVLVSDSALTPGPLPNGQFEEPLLYAASGQMMPGLYQLRVELSDELLALGDSSDPPWSYGIGGGGTGAFSLKLTAPEPASAMTLAIGLALCRRVRARRA